MARNPYTYDPVTFEPGDSAANDLFEQLANNARYLHFVLSQFVADLDDPPDSLADLLGATVLQQGWKVALSNTVTWTFKPVANSDGDLILVKKADIDFDDLDVAAADRVIDLPEL